MVHLDKQLSGRPPRQSELVRVLPLVLYLDANVNAIGLYTFSYWDENVSSYYHGSIPKQNLCQSQPVVSSNRSCFNNILASTCEESHSHAAFQLFFFLR